MGSSVIFAQNREVLQVPPYAFPPAQVGISTDITQEISVSFPSAAPSKYPENEIVPVTAFLPAQADGPVPVVILLHHLGATDNSIQIQLATRLNRQGIAAVMIPLPYHLARRPKGKSSDELTLEADLDGIRGWMIQACQDVRRTIDWISTQPLFDSKKIGISGVSLGAIVSSLVAGVDDRISAMAFLVGGVDFTEMVYSSSKAVHLREWISRQGLTRADVTTRFEDVEPRFYLANSRPRPSLVVRAKEDRVVPPACTDALIASLHEPTVINVQTGHVGISLEGRAILGAVNDFFQGVFLQNTTKPLPLALKGLKIRTGPFFDGIDGLQVAAGVDFFESNQRIHVGLSGVLTPRGPRVYAWFETWPNVSLGVSTTGKKTTFGLFWSFVY